MIAPDLARVETLWVYLAADPLLWLTVTLATYVVADRLSSRLDRHPLANPVLIAVALLAAILSVTRTPFETYFQGAQFVHFLLGPATAALALPLHRHWPLVRKAVLPILAALLAGALTAVISAIGIAAAFGVPQPILASLAPKSVTAAIAMGIAREIGGEPSLTATLVIATGILGAVMVTPLMIWLGFTDWRARGFAAGLAAHGIGTARAFQVNPVAGAFAGIAMGLNGLVTAVLVPLILRLF
ncbi:LrgB family protein [Bosea sp. (in: a-proteobacteria)]|uniref:LrgB family protein n=1 Tax=Bosea sp. (in: a-proteobacteria) TaxID=1871050 RepID=UPI002733031C|nr:LrgB family protein [Bosea sp. (in: a-proteobacteria)]MDP3410406.1 LrgB family protein [Bosea sp. (in: a-proteobacteria)]